MYIMNKFKSIKLKVLKGVVYVPTYSQDFFSLSMQEPDCILHSSMTQDVNSSVFTDVNSSVFTYVEFPLDFIHDIKKLDIYYE